jgi:hypothetical protein
MDQLWYGDLLNDVYINRHWDLLFGSGGPSQRKVDEALVRARKQQI